MRTNLYLPGSLARQAAVRSSILDRDSDAPSRRQLRLEIPPSTALGLALCATALTLAIDCSPPAATLSGPAAVYAKATANFAKGQTDSDDKAVESLESLTNGDSSNDYTNRA